MKRIDITTSETDDDCDLCGSCFGRGGVVKIDGKEVLDIEPFASCFGGIYYEDGELLVLALSRVGIDVYVDGEKFHITRFDEEYHKDKLEGGTQ